MDRFTVLRPHQGDRFYRVGDTREARRCDVQHLIPNTLSPKGEKAAPKPSNKAEPKPLNKAERPASNKSKA